MNTSIVAGSLSDVAQRKGESVAESFMQADTVIVVDVSGSMDTCDSRDGLSRYTVACQELTHLQASLPGKVAVVAFSEAVEFVPGGVPSFMGKGTALHLALEFVRIADGTVGFIVISDGQPDDPASCLRIARTFRSKIDCVFTGPEGDLYGGAAFLRQLAEASGGQYVLAAQAQELAKKVETLMLGSSV